MTDCIALINNIKRSETAYKIYCKHPNYHHALHIFYANEQVYNYLNKLLSKDSITEDTSEKIFDYLFHLEDWFLQFSFLERDVINIEGQFSFDTLKNGVPYPSNFLEAIEK